MLYCKHCGAQIDDDATFCPKCGKSQAAAPAKEEKEPEAIPEVKQKAQEPPKFDPEVQQKSRKPLYKKWWFWLIVAVVVITVGKKVIPPAGTDSRGVPIVTETPKPAKTPAPTAKPKPAPKPTEKPTPRPTEKPIEKAAYDITYCAAKIYKGSLGNRVQVMVEFENTGTTNLQLSSGSFDLEDENGKLVSSRQMVSAYPDILAPGERGIMYEDMSLDDYEEGTELVVVPRLDIKKTDDVPVRYAVTDVELSLDRYSRLKIMGRVENTTDKAESFIYVVAILYGEDDVPIGQIFTILMDKIGPGEKVGFEMSESFLPKDVTESSVKDMVIYSYPM